MKTEEGVMVMKNGKAWGTEYADGHSTSYGWIAAEDAPIHDPKYCTKATDVTHRGSRYYDELLTGTLVKVKRTTLVEVQV
jgi:hypothetical protein